MSSPDALALSTPLLRPAPGGSTRVRIGRFELVLEAVRGGHSLLWVDGRQARRFALGLGSIKQLSLQLEPPAWPCRVVMRETLVLAPGGRLRGYVQLPLVPAVLGQRDDGQDLRLLELANADLAGEWDERLGTTFRVTSSWHVRFPMPTGEARATVPLYLHNDGNELLAPADVPVHLRRDELFVRRGSLVAAPRRLRWNGQAWNRASNQAAQVLP